MIKNIKNNSARARVRHADGVSINDDEAIDPRLKELREQIKTGNMEFYSEYNEVDL